MGSHDHDSACNHAAPFAPNARLWFVLLLTLSYMVAEIIGGYLSGSLALVADAGHMAIDSAAIALSLFALWISRKPPTDEKTYGYHRAEILAALVNGATLIAVSFGIFYEAWGRMKAPPPVQGGLMTAIAAGGFLVNLVALGLMHTGSRNSLNLRGVWLHLLSDALGSLSAMTAAFLIWRYQWYLADPLISALIAVLILFGAWKLVTECVNVLLEGVPKGIDVTQIKSDVMKLAGVSEMHDLHVWTLATGVPSLSAHVRVAEGMDHAVVLQKICCILKETHGIEHVTLQLEPPAYDHQRMHV